MNCANCPFAAELNRLLRLMADGDSIEEAHDELQRLLANVEWLLRCEDCAQNKARWACLLGHGRDQAQGILDYWAAQADA